MAANSSLARSGEMLHDFDLSLRHFLHMWLSLTKVDAECLRSCPKTFGNAFYSMHCARIASQCVTCFSLFLPCFSIGFHNLGLWPRFRPAVYTLLIASCRRNRGLYCIVYLVYLAKKCTALFLTNIVQRPSCSYPSCAAAS